MFGKMVLPLLGGTPAVWNTCLVFFQAALLLGYLYAHGQRTFLPFRTQLVTHLVLVACFAFLLPVKVPAGWLPPTEANPIPWLLLLLSISVGLPFVMISATAPMLQNWFARSGKKGSEDPYFLYVASNLGSLAGLLGYPLFIEPHLTLREQSWAWSAGYVALLGGMFLGAAMLWKNHQPYSIADDRRLPAPAWKTRLHWLALAAVPSSLLQSVTSHLTTDIAAVPLLWVVPLAVYLVTFVLVFSRRQLLPHRVMLTLQPVALLLAVVLVFWANTRNFLWIFPCDMLVLFLTGMVCHGEMVRLRPSAEHLTEFYLWMSVGGVLGGIFNAIVAPAVFTTLAEYPITLVVAGLLRPALVADSRTVLDRGLDLVIPFFLALSLSAAAWGVQSWSGTPLNPVHLGLAAGLAGLVIYSFSGRPIRFGLGLAALIAAGLVAGTFTASGRSETLTRERNFFGSIRIIADHTHNRMHMVHNTTNHGSQNRGAGQRRVPVSYYSAVGPVGDVFRCIPGQAGKRRVAVVGLGAGSLACYARPGEHWVFYEINPAVVKLGRNTDYFSFLAGCPAKVDVELGDARLSMVNAADHSYDVIILDAFSSDAVPVHLVTREAVALYLTKLADNGLLLFNITNNHLDLGLLFRNLALDAKLSGLARFHGHSGLPLLQTEMGIAPSYWVVMARSAQQLRCIAEASDWKTLDLVAPPDASTRPWTDDFSNILDCMMALRGLPLLGR